MASNLKIVLSIQGSMVVLVSPSLEQDFQPQTSKLNFSGGELNIYEFYQQ